MNNIRSWFAHLSSNLAHIFERSFIKQVEISQKDQAFHNDICARCRHPRHAHRYEAIDCVSCDYPAKCQQFLTGAAFTEALRIEWKSLLEQAHELERQDGDWDDPNLELINHQEEQDELDAIRRKFEPEQSCQWGEPITLSYHNPDFGWTSLGMLEGEWIRSFEDMRRLKMLPKEQIDDLERKFEQVKRDLYQ